MANRSVRFTRHAQDRCQQRNATEQEILYAIEHGTRDPVGTGRILCRATFPLDGAEQGSRYSVKQVTPLITVGADEISVVTVYVFFG